MAIVTAVMSVVLTLAVVVLIDVVATPSAREEVGRSLEELAIQTTEKLDAGMFERYREMSLLAQSPVLADTVASEGRFRDVVDRYQKTYPYYAWIGLTDTSGTVKAATAGLLEGVNVASRPWFGSALAGVHVGDVHAAKLLASILPASTRYPGEPKRFVDLAFPIRDASGEVKGVVGAHLDWEWAWDVTRSVIDPAALRRHVDVLILSSDGTVLLGPPDLRQTKLDLENFGLAKPATHGYIESAGEDGRPYLVGYSSGRGYRDYPGLGWTVLVRQPIGDAYASIRKVRQPVIVLGSVLALAFCLIGMLAARQITRPLVRLAESAGEVASGKRDTLDEIVTSYPELNALAEAFQRMVVGVKLTEVTLRAMNQTLEGRVADRTAELQASRERLQLITDNVPALIAFCDQECRYQFCNRAYLDWLGKSEGEVIDRHATEVLPPDVADSLRQNVDRVLLGEEIRFEDRQRSGEQERYREVSYIPLRDSQQAVSGFYVLAYDITERKREQLSLQHGISHDILTGLPNRKELPGRIEQAKARSRRNQTPFAVLFLDIDRFKHINDTWGHAVGDQVLIEFSRRLVSAMRETDLVVRLAGDEFVIIAEGLGSEKAGSERIAAKILSAFAEPLIVNGQTLQIATSIGIAMSEPGCQTSADELINRADAGMYAAKQTGRNRYCFADEATSIEI